MLLSAVVSLAGISLAPAPTPERERACSMADDATGLVEICVPLSAIARMPGGASIFLAVRP